MVERLRLAFLCTTGTSHSQSLHRHDFDHALEHSPLLHRSRVFNSMIMLKVRNHIVELDYLHYILLHHSLGFGIHRRLQDADLMAIDIYYHVSFYFLNSCLLT